MVQRQDYLLGLFNSAAAQFQTIEGIWKDVKRTVDIHEENPHVWMNFGGTSDDWGLAIAGLHNRTFGNGKYTIKLAKDLLPENFIPRGYETPAAEIGGWYENAELLSVILPESLDIFFPVVRGAKRRRL